MTISFVHGRLSECTTQIMVSGKLNGFGFFVAQNTLLTCDHVVPKAEESDLRVRWNNEEFPARIKKRHEQVDLALLSVVELGHHPCLPLSQDIVSFDILHTQWCEESLLVKGFAGRSEKIVLKGGKGSIRKGHSGTPVFNSRTESVCGFILSRGESEEEVHATNIKHALEILPELASIQKSPSNTLKIFIVHAEGDENLLNKWIPLLHDSNLPRLVLCWNREEDDGFGWTPPPMFNEADIIVLLVSSEYYNTDTYYKTCAQALPGKTQVIQVLPPDGCASVMGWPGRSVTFRDSAQCIREMAEALNITDS